MTKRELEDIESVLVDIDPWDIENENVLREYKEDCFKMWENAGFKDRYMSQVDPDEPYNNTPFKVLRRATEEECELHCMPLWLVELYDGHTAYCGPDKYVNSNIKIYEIHIRNLYHYLPYNGSNLFSNI